MKHKQPHLSTGFGYWSHLGYLSAIYFLTVLPCIALGAELRLLKLEAGWTEVTNSLCFVHLRSCRVFGWWIWRFGLLLLIYIAHGKCCVCPGKCSLPQAWHHFICVPWMIHWLGLAAESILRNILKLPWSCSAGLNSFVSSIPVSSWANHNKKIIYALQIWQQWPGSEFLMELLSR